jgi:hypothetical protein
MDIAEHRGSKRCPCHCLAHGLRCQRRLLPMKERGGATPGRSCRRGGQRPSFQQPLYPCRHDLHNIQKVWVSVKHGQEGGQPHAAVDLLIMSAGVWRALSQSPVAKKALIEGLGLACCRILVERQRFRQPRCRVTIITHSRVGSHLCMRHRGIPCIVCASLRQTYPQTAVHTP